MKRLVFIYLIGLLLFSSCIQSKYSQGRIPASTTKTSGSFEFEDFDPEFELDPDFDDGFYESAFIGNSEPDVVGYFSDDETGSKVYIDSVFQFILSASGLEGKAINVKISSDWIPKVKMKKDSYVREICLNPNFLKVSDSKTNSKWTTVGILAHELRHYLHQDPVDNSSFKKSIELGADKYAGYILGLLGANVEFATNWLDAYDYEGGEQDYPDIDLRKKAALAGWNNAEIRINNLAGRLAFVEELKSKNAELERIIADTIAAITYKDAFKSELTSIGVNEHSNIENAEDVIERFNLKYDKSAEPQLLFNQVKGTIKVDGKYLVTEKEGQVDTIGTQNANLSKLEIFEKPFEIDERGFILETQKGEKVEVGLLINPKLENHEKF